MDVSGEAKILKDDRGICKTTLATSTLNTETGEEEKAFMKINVSFKKGVEVKNKTRINITRGFLTFFRVDTGEVRENGKPIYHYFPKIMILDFDVVEEGIDEVYQRKDYSKKEDEGMAFYESDDLPF